MFSKIRVRILFGFFAVMALATLFILISSYFLNKKNELYKISHELQDTQILILQDIAVQKDFFSYDITNPIFYKTGTSQYLLEHQTLSEAIQQKIEQISTMNGIESFKMDTVLNTIVNDINEYNFQLDSVVKLIRVRGFETTGYEGELLNTIKKIENQNLITKDQLNKINYYEKEYFMHGDKSYVDSINRFIERIIEFSYITNQPNNAAHLLRKYNLSFTQLAYLDELLGLHQKEGMRINLDQLAEEIGIKFSLLVDNVDFYEKRLTNLLILTYIIIGLTTLVVTIAVSLIISRQISKPIVYLSSQINAFVGSKFSLLNNIETTKARGEIGQLASNFIILRDEIIDYINYFKEKVDERTAELLVEKNKVENQKEEIEAQRDALDCQNQLIVKQKKEVEKQRENVISSIRYASRIQQALLSDEEQLKNLLPNSFLLQKPKDIVSGDFCYVERIKGNGKDYTVLILADCTGHGVPGAFMSLLCHNYLNQIIKIDQHINPVYVLAKLNNMIYSNFHRKNGGNKIMDGLDISYLLINNQTGCCQFAGAHNPLYIIRDNEIKIIKGDKLSIGGKDSIVRKITNHTIQLEKTDTIYLFTDGYVDQDGENNLEKFKYKRFRELLLYIHQQTFDQQKEILESTIVQWKGQRDQVDDISVLGFRISTKLDLMDNPLHKKEETFQLQS